ncbi:DUF6597 domain-containing transcriptional factor [Chryseosolibacter indicus]|uniref:HTH araC/xylS-type domain-containing protein n=1 Tax=Chryseosolibacter indicus TaxID=2782351 RepID=A0ABS5VVU5_9BACT|nr:DUF6597 domain-containing transcriptional factor [Chryseosolibacter indicus]MBT1704116.1 hypothetical protein [Chryseosolibacter indicus]
MKKVIFESESVAFLKLAYPQADLRWLVEYYFEVDNGEKPTEILGLPSVNTLLAFHLRQPGASINERTGTTIRLPQIALLGNTTDAFTGLYPRSSKIFYVKLKANARSLIFNYPAAEVLNNQIDISHKLKGFSSDQFLTLATFQERVWTIENYLKKFCLSNIFTYKQKQVATMINQLSNSAYTEPESIERLCARNNITYASARRYFLEELGVSPKFYQKALRFKSALKSYKVQGYKFNAFDFGYTDFSHFCKDAKDLSGRQPSLL